MGRVWNLYKIHFGVVTLFVAGIIFDLLIPLGVAAGVVYVLPVLVTYGFESRRTTYIATILGVVLTLCGFITSPDGGELWKVIANRVLAIVAIVTVGLAIVKVKRHKADLAEQTELALASQLQAVEANKAKTVFLSSISHELKTPLNAVLGFSQVLLHEPEITPSQKESIDYILKSGRQLSEMIHQAIEFTYIQDGTFQVQIHQSELIPLVNHAIEHVKPLANNKNIFIDTSRIETFPIKTINCDPNLLSTVVLNLLKNAVQYNQDNGKVTLCYTLDENHFLRLSFCDTGIGISDTHILQLFKPFTRLSQNNSDHLGLGLGLAKAKILIEAMGGHIGLSRNEDVGMTFWIDLKI